MLSVPTPASDTVKPTPRTRRVNRHNGQPAAPQAPPSGLNYGKRAKGVEIDLADLFEPELPELPDILRTAIGGREAAGDALPREEPRQRGREPGLRSDDRKCR